MGGVSGFAVEVQKVGGVFSVLIVACAAPAGSVRPVGSFSMSLRTCKAQPEWSSTFPPKNKIISRFHGGRFIFILSLVEKWPGKVVFSSE